MITTAGLDGRAGRLLSLALITRTGRRRTVGSDLMRGRGLETPRLSVGADDRHCGHSRIRTRVRAVRLMPLLKIRCPGGQFGALDHADDGTHVARDTTRAPAARKQDHRREREQRQEPSHRFTDRAPHYLMSVSILNIGRYIEMTIVPTIAPTPIIRIGSMIEVSDWMLASTSSS